MNKRFAWLLAAEGALCAAFCFLREGGGSVFSAVAVLPFEQIGRLLRWLSGLGRLGAGLALAVYSAVCLLPLWLLLRERARRPLRAEDGLLALLSALLLLTLWLMTNPGYLDALFPALGPLAAKAMLGSVVWSVLAGCLVLRALRVCAAAGMEGLLRGLGVLLRLLAALFVAVAVGGGLSGLLESLRALDAANTGAPDGLGLTRAFLCLRAFADALPWALDAWAALLALRLLGALREDGGREAVPAAEGLARFCGRALAAVMLSEIALNLLQLVCADRLRDIHTGFTFPVAALCFVAAALLFARVVAENRRLRDDNDLMI